MGKWRVTDKAGWDERTGKAVYTVTKDSTSLNAGDQNELKALLDEAQAVREALTNLVELGDAPLNQYAEAIKYAEDVLQK